MNSIESKKDSVTPRVCVIGIDGVPFTFIQKRFGEGAFPNLRKLRDSGDMKQMNSVIPPISSVAWATFMTGKNPAKHGIFGFVDRVPSTMDMKIPTSVDMRSKTLWEILSDRGKRVVAMNVPGSYPPRKVNGKLISCFLCTDINKGAHPPELAKKLKEIGYIIDVDPWKARTEPDEFLIDLFKALKKRLETTLWLLESEKPDFLISHIMETDRISHFFWEYMETGDKKYADIVLKFFDRVDAFIGEVAEKLPEETLLIAMSDHGFCTLKKEYYLNVAMEEAGFLKLANDDPKSPKDIHPDTTAYSMIPGRVFVNLKGREKTGSVAQADYEKVREDVTAFLLGLKDPEDGSPIINKVFRREEIYHGPLFEEAADLVALPHDGYDLKGNLKNPTLMMKGALVGMHTDWDAALCVRGRKIKDVDKLHIVDVMPSILAEYGIEDPALDLDGRLIFEDM